MKDDRLSRREFMRDGAIAAAGLAAGLGAMGSKKATAADETAIRKTRSYNPEMEYRRLGKTGLWVSAVCLGGHWKKLDTVVPGVFRGSSRWLNADLNSEGFRRNRREVVTRCIERGINYIDACTWQEAYGYSEALRDRRDSMYLGFSWYQEEMRNEQFRKAGGLLKTLDKGMQLCRLDYVDLWRITMLPGSAKHTEEEVGEMIGALEKARQQGKVRFTGLSSHDRPHIKSMIETYPDVVQVVVTPYTAKTKELPKDSVFDAIRKHDVGMFGIKPFAGGASFFKGDGSPGCPEAGENDRLARMAVRYILCNPAVTAPIPGMINAHQVDNMAKAVKERRELDTAEAKELEEAMDRAWANLPANYQWLKNWEYV
ncbi:MAG: aldo/keto reductase [Planctomycetota bacterium]